MTATAAHIYGATPGAIGRAMPAETTRRVDSSDTTETATARTWKDWWPDEPSDPEHLLTRQQLVDRARTEGLDITLFDIANWQRVGAIPPGVPRQVGQVRETLYPERFLGLLRDLQEYRKEGVKLTRLGPLLRMKHTPRVSGSASISVSGSARAHVRRGDPTLTANDVLAQTLRDIARAHEATYSGRRIVEARLTLIDEAGDELALSVDTD